MLTGALRSLFAVVENYPHLKANENVLSLQEQLTTTENQISFSRQHYNATVLDYNTSHPDVPGVLIAGPLGFTKREFFEAEPEAQQSRSSDLSWPAAESRLSASDHPGAPMADHVLQPDRGEPAQLVAS